MRALLLALFGMALPAWAGDPALTRTLSYTGMCDASGAVAVSSNLFIVASDEDNTLRLYRNDQAGAPIKEFNFNTFLDLHGKSAEADLEGAAKIGDRAFWIGSHGRNKDGKDRPNRCRLFATDIAVTNGEVTLSPVGQPCTTLLRDLINDSKFDQFHFAEAARRIPKEADALNIEGLSATPEGHLLIGFRNPIPQGKALLIPLLNPDEVIAGKPARFDPAIQLDLGGLGIRDITFHNGSYLIIAGSYHSGGKFRFYRWAGAGAMPERLRVEHFQEYNPEAIIVYPERGMQAVQILSDDGNRIMEGVPCKDLKDPGRQAFRSFWVVQ
jgi:hypothetical protein